MRMAIKDKLLAFRLTRVATAGVAALLTLVIVFGLVAYPAISDARNRMQSMEQRDQVMLIAAMEMQLGMRGMTITSLEFLATPAPALRDRLLKHSADFKHDMDRYREAASGDAKQSENAGKGAELFNQYERASLAMIDRRIELEKLLTGIHGNFKNLDQRIKTRLMGDAEVRDPARPEKLRLAAQIGTDVDRIMANLSEYMRTQSPPARESMNREIDSFNVNLTALEKQRN